MQAWCTRRVGDDNEAETPAESPRFGLFAYPAQSNMTGHRLSLSLPAKIRSSPPHGEIKQMFVLLDAAAYAMTAPLDLGDHATAPDFVALSLYKIFGYPDLGALIVRKSPEVSDLVRGRRFFGGGTVDMVTVMRDAWVARKDASIHAQLEDGTLPIHSILALGVAMRVHGELYRDMASVSRHTAWLAKRLYEGMSGLRHWNGSPLCIVYKEPDARYGNATTQGPTVAFNLQDTRGRWIGKSDVERLAVVRGIHLRTGGLCNPGGIATHCGFTDDEMRRNFAEGVRCGNEIDIVDGKPTGVVRVSLGAMSSAADVDTFLGFLRDLFLETYSRETAKTSLRHAVDEKVAFQVPEGALDSGKSSLQLSSIDARPGAHRCPVWDCSAECMSADELEWHLRRHRGVEKGRLWRWLKGLVGKA